MRAAGLMPTPRFSIRVDPAELKRWKKAAKAEGLDVSAWIRSRCNIPAEPPSARQATYYGNMPRSKRKAKPTPSASVSCPHPKAQRRVLNGGIVKCDACKELVK